MAPDSGADPAVGQWITEIQARKLAAGARLRAAIGRLSNSSAECGAEIIAESATLERNQVICSPESIRE